ncbi:prolyl 4-hydroxylase [Tieghemostelium lacteum]|uniref:Prolyl 4-hydroxylase n=1 Tax=Tieghemostelium lacteum TaxID=361077 RepID=A0A151Z2T2_TIELA|nr:prolyl 4-hydroxylase [Tieghemostelium lacteum]|eukprot:KYQ88259.1 prolyl 4-hydroxylase [Tieghemostelium lacteum]
MDLGNLPSNLKFQILSILGNKDDKGSKEITNEIEVNDKINLSDNIEEQFLKLFSRDSLLDLQEKGFIVVDNFLKDREIIDGIYEETLTLYQNGSVKQAGMNKSTEKWNDKMIRGDYMMWLNKDTLKDKMDSIPNISSLLKELEGVRSELDTVVKHFNSQKISTQLAVYPKGGRYVKHRDSFTGQGVNRRITMIYYYNKNWKKEDGGELRLYTNNKNSGNSNNENKYVDIEPIADRLLLFLSPFMEHEVLESHSEYRMAITTWIY